MTGPACEGLWTGPQRARRDYRVDANDTRQGGQGVLFVASLCSDRLGEGLRGARVGLKQLTGVAPARWAKLSDRSGRLACLSHPGLARHLETFRGPAPCGAAPPEDECDLYYAAHVWVEGETLSDFAGRVAPDVVLDWVRHLAATLDFLHGLPDGPIAHRDLHPGNVVIARNGIPVVIDYETALPFEDSASGTNLLMGRVGFIPPERTSDSTARADAGDRWQLGMLAVYTLLGYPQGAMTSSQLSEHLHNRLTGQVRDPNATVEALLGMLRLRPQDRPESCTAWAEALTERSGPVRSAPDPCAGADIGSRLVEAMNQAGLTEPGLANRLGILPGDLRRYITGERLPTRDLVAAWEQACNQNAGALSSQDDGRRPQTSPAGPADHSGRGWRRTLTSSVIAAVLPLLGLAFWWTTRTASPTTQGGQRTTTTVETGITLATVVDRAPPTVGGDEPYTLTTLPSTGSKPSLITTGPDGALWFTEQASDSVWRLLPGGTPQRARDLNPGSHPFGITQAADGAVWFTEGEADGTSGDAVGRLNPDGSVAHRTALPKGSQPTGIVAGPDGHMWVTGYGSNSVYRIAPNGQVSGGPFAVDGNPNRIVVGPDKNIWVTIASSSRVVVLSAGGTFLKAYSVAPGPTDIVVGRDAKVWITSHNSGSLQWIDPVAGEVSAPILVNGGPGAMVVGPDGNLWFTQLSGHSVGVVSPTGALVRSIPIAGGTPFGITVGPDGAVWFTLQGGGGQPDAIGRIPVRP